MNGTGSARAAGTLRTAMSAKVGLPVETSQVHKELEGDRGNPAVYERARGRRGRGGRRKCRLPNEGSTEGHDEQDRRDRRHRDRREHLVVTRTWEAGNAGSADCPFLPSLDLMSAQGSVSCRRRRGRGREDGNRYDDLMVARFGAVRMTDNKVCAGRRR